MMLTRHQTHTHILSYGSINPIVATIATSTASSSSSILSLDFGSDYLKSSLTSSSSNSIGTHIDVIINEQSLRKTQNLVGFDQEMERLGMSERRGDEDEDEG